jgi:hypothetical protein
MALQFDYSFPQDFRSPVVAADAEAEQRFRDTVGPSNGWRRAWHHQIKDAAFEYVETVVLAFANQACAAVRAGRLAVDRVAWLVEDFEQKLAGRAYFDLDVVALGAYRDFRPGEEFYYEVRAAIRQSPGWREHLHERAECAIAGAPAQVPNVASTPLQPEFITANQHADRAGAVSETETSEGAHQADAIDATTQRPAAVTTLDPEPPTTIDLPPRLQTEDQHRDAVKETREEMPLRTSADRPAAVNAFLKAANQAWDGPLLKKQHVWRAARYRNRRQFEYWQAGSRRAGTETDQNICAILRMTPTEFIQTLKNGCSPM